MADNPTFEPLADALVASGSVPYGEAALASIAISLKRIADILAGTGGSYGLIDVLATLDNTIHNKSI